MFIWLFKDFIFTLFHLYFDTTQTNDMSFTKAFDISLHKAIIIYIFTRKMHWNKYSLIIVGNNINIHPRLSKVWIINI